jgi:hypothetical protein
VPGFGFTTFVPPGQTAEARLKPVAAFNAKIDDDLKKHPFVWNYDDNGLGQALQGAGSRLQDRRPWLARGPADPGGDHRGRQAARPRRQPLSRPE